MTLDIKAWLGQSGLEEYAEAFFENSIEADLTGVTELSAALGAEKTHNLPGQP